VFDERWTPRFLAFLLGLPLWSFSTAVWAQEACPSAICTSSDYNAPKNPFDLEDGWQCTRYAWGRALQQTGAKIAFFDKGLNKSVYPNAGKWFSEVTNYPAVPTVAPYSIAVWCSTSKCDANGDGHVAYVESVSGNMVTFTDMNSNGLATGSYPNYNDWESHSITVDQMATYLGYVLQGYIHLQVANTGEPTISSSLTLSPASGPYAVGQQLSATFTITNESSTPATVGLATLTVGGRLNGICPGDCPDFQPYMTDVGLGPWGSVTYSGTLTPSAAGTYNFFTAYQNFDGTWNTSIPTDPGIVNAQTITVIGGSCSASDSLRAVGSLRPAGAGTTCPPLPPDTPSPANGASNVGVVALLSWSGGTPAPSYQLYLGTSNPPPLVATVNGTSYGVGLDPSSTYFWYVVPNLSGAAASMTWSFMTTSSGIAPPSPPTSLFPGNGSTNVGLNPTLTWAPPNGATSYQVAFGLTNPPFAAATITIPSYSPGALGGNATYYWKVTAVNGAGSSSSSIYSFTTMTSPVSGPILVSGLSNPVSITEDTNSIYWSEFGGLIRFVSKSGGTPTTLYASGYNSSGIAVDATNAYFGDGLGIRSIPKSGGSSSLIASYNPFAVAIDSTNVYWTDYDAGAIRKVPKTGGSVTTLATGSNSPAGIATDGLNVYWSESSFPGVVRSVPVGGGTATILGYNVNNNGIAIDFSNVYWGENLFTNQAKIDRAPLTGGTTTNLATGLNNVWNVATDGSSVFWVENGTTTGAVKQVTVNGSGPVTLASNLSSPVALTVDSTDVYWIERADGGTGSGTLKKAPKMTTVQVVVGTNVAGLSFQVDGTTYTSAQGFVWLQGSTHTITATTQSGAVGTQYSWQSWSDTGAGSHSIAPSFYSTYTATFEVQYYFTSTASTGGSVSPPSDWYDAGTVIPVSAVPGSGYGFVGFSGDITGIATPQYITMNGPHSVSATFALVYSKCDINRDGSITVTDVQAIINEALGVTPATNDLNGDGVVNVSDVQIVINAALGLGCAAK
jgi:hypothetical protein